MLDHNVRRTFARPLLVRVSGYSSARLAGSGSFSFFCGLSALGVLCSSKRFCEVAERADVAVDLNGKFPARLTLILLPAMTIGRLMVATGTIANEHGVQMCAPRSREA